MTRREIVDRMELEARRRADIAREVNSLHRPWWLDDSEPGPVDDHDGGPQMFAWVGCYAVVVLVLLALGAWAWQREDGWQQRAYCAQLLAASAPSLPTYCEEGK